MSTRYTGPEADVDEAGVHEAADEVANTDARGRKLGLAHRLYTGDISYDFVGHWKRWFLISGVLLALALGSLAVQGLKLGIEFRGGADFSVPAAVGQQSTEQFQDAVHATNLPDLDSTQVLTVGDREVNVQTRSLTPDEVTTVRAAIAKTADTTPDRVTYSLIGPSWGHQITAKALQALGVFLVLVSLLIWIYFRDPKMSVAALVALLHDLVLTVGIYSLVGFTVTPATMIGVLTILGYSLYDTVVVFDKVRENVRGLTGQRRSYTEAANTAVNQVLVRSLNTTIIGVLPVAALLFAGVFVLGSGPLEDLGLALFVGMVAGAYSSIFIATPLLALLKEREPAMREHREKLVRRNERLATAEPVAVEAGSTVASPAVATASTRSQATRTQPTRTTRTTRTGAQRTTRAHRDDQTENR